MIRSVNPYNGTQLHTFEELTALETEKKLSLAQSAFEHHRGTPLSLRSELMNRVAATLNQNKRKYAESITAEMGKPITQALAEVEKCAWVCNYYALHAPSQLAREVIDSDAESSFVSFEPLGVVLAIMPWNYPFWQVFRFAAPALMAGNVGLLKHASNVMKSASHIEEVFRLAGFPEGCFQNLIIKSKAVEGIIGSKEVRAVTLTGSKPAGASVASVAGREIKKTVLELGGSNALVIFEDADIDAAVNTCVEARFQNTGQSCIAGKRLLIQNGIYEEFLEKFAGKVGNLRSGDPMDPETYIGVLAREDLAKDLEDQVNRSVAQGARILTGGQRKGTYFEPTIVTDVTSEMPMFVEETFGPAIGITRFETDEEAIRIVNKSEFGLGVSIFTTSRKRVPALINRFNEGAVFVNELVKSDPRLPFGGIKNSGYGRELSRHGILEFVNKKTVYINGLH